ncbi:hypothetical protein ABZX12_09150 [Kribbella sp. NPDC003505]|uniref:hypothetical protein n=1 Tax=Kribbella sp. NPDC003505 TaxID=3154448 RepID=UPI0033B6DD74
MRTHSLVETVRDLRKAGEVTSEAMQLLQRGILTADAELREGHMAGRLPALQDVRLTLYRLPVAEVTAHARLATDAGDGNLDSITLEADPGVVGRHRKEHP